MRCLQRIILVILLGFLTASMPAAAQIRVYGTLLGTDGQPMPAAHIVVQDGPVDTSIVAAADEHGRFSLQLPQMGGYGMYLTGVHHGTLEVPLIITDTEPVELHVRLGTYDYPEDLDSVWVTTAATGYEKQGAVLMQQEGTTYVASVPAETDTLAYQIIGVRKSLTPRYVYTISSTEADWYAFDESGPFWDSESDYVSVVKASGEAAAEITFEPNMLPPPDRKPSFRSENPPIDGIVSVYLETEAMERRIGEEALRHQALFGVAETDEEREALGDSLRQAMAQLTGDLSAPIRRRIEIEEDPLLRHWLMLRYFDELHPAEDSTMARRALQEVPPTSPLWSYEAWSNVGASNLIVSLARQAKAPELVRAYMDHVIEEHPDPDVHRQFLYRAIGMADYAGDEKRKMVYYGQMMDEFAGSWHAERIERQYAPEKAVQSGNPIPNYALTAMNEPGVIYTDDNMKGVVYLIDAWAVWCGPCVAEMGELHEAYEKYRDEGFDILSISLDEKPQDVEAFRQERWPLPWKHHFAGFSGEGRKVIEETFEVVGIPHPILVDEDGEIIATEEELRGEKLIRTLESVFNGK